MKTAGLHLLCLIVAASLATRVSAAAPVAQPPDTPSDLSAVALAKEGPVKISLRLKEEIRASLPKFAASPPPVLDQPHDLPSDPELFALPKYTVKEKRPPSHDPDVWLTDKTVQQKALAAYKQSLTDLEWALNSWYIPIIGSSPSARARGSYENQKKMSELQRVHRLFKVISTSDPKAGADLETERVKMDQAEDWQNRWR